MLGEGSRVRGVLSAFIGFCHELDAEGVQVVSEIYEDLESTDIAHVLGLHDQPIDAVRCRSDDGHRTLEIVLPSATVRLVEVDPQDPHSDSRFEVIRPER